MKQPCAHPGSDVIAFNLPGAGVHSIVTGGLPVITEAVSLDGTTQPGYGGLPLVELRADVDGFNPAAISIAASGCAVRGLTISQRMGMGLRSK